jgi:hypothetical protein
MNEQVLDEKYIRNGMKTKRMNIRRKTFPQKKKSFFTFGLVNNKHEKDVECAAVVRNHSGSVKWLINREPNDILFVTAVDKRSFSNFLI